MIPRIALFTTLLFPLAAHAQQPKFDVILLPRDVAQAALNWIGAPDPATAVRLFSALAACLGDNPHDGVTTRTGADQCPAVTEAIAARDAQIADLTKQLADAKKPAEPSKP